MGSGANTPGRASRPIEHPGRNLQPSRGCPTGEAATENLSASPLNHLMNMDHASGPRMPRIKKLVLHDPVGVPSSCCTTPSERISRCIRMRRFFVRFNGSESFVRTRSSAGFTIITSGFEFSVHTGTALHPQFRLLGRRNWDLGRRGSYSGLSPSAANRRLHSVGGSRSRSMPMPRGRAPPSLK